MLFAVIGVVASWSFVAGPPGVGHFRSAEGRGEYVAASEDAMDALPDPTAVHDVRTSHGTVRAYEWATEQHRDQRPALLVPGRASGVPMWAENLPVLAQQRRVLVFDALGDAGLSEHSVPLASDDSLAGGRAAADRAGQLPRPTVVTWSDTTHSLPMQAAGELEREMLEFVAAHEER